MVPDFHYHPPPPRPQPPPLTRPATTGDIPLVSPIEEIPSTLPPPPPPQIRHQTSASGQDLWLPTAVETRLAHTEETLLLGDDFLDHHDDDDDELPDYAESQAQAQAAQRAEATRRARELQQRWHASGGRQ